MSPSRTPSQRSLLLLPPAPSPPTYAALKAAYNSSLLTVLRQLARSPTRTHEPVLLEIALPCPHLYGHLASPRTPLYATTQSLVANLYKLICVIASKDAIDTEDAGGVDARIVLVAYPRDGRLLHTAEDATPEQELQGPAIDLHTLARCPRPWDTVYAVETEQGAVLLNNFLSLGPSDRNISKVRGGIVPVETLPVAEPAEREAALTNHLSVAVGGTFDHLHIGHKLLLTMFAFVLGRRPSSFADQGASSLTIGITGDELLKNKKYRDVLEGWGRRQEAVHEFLASLINFGRPDDNRIQLQEFAEPGPNGHAVHATFPNLRVKYVEIMDPFGPTITDEAISALVISKETRSGGQAVNQKREEKGWAPLQVFEVDVLDAGEEEEVDETFQGKLSSTEIRRRLSERARSTGAHV